MRLLFLTLIISAACLTVSAQVPDASKNLKQQAEKAGNSMVHGDYRMLAKYTYPPVVKMMGGAENMAATVQKLMANMKAQGVAFNNVSFGEPTKMFKSGNELQSTIAQHLEMQIKESKLVSTSTLIAISTDNGVNWTFVDTSNKDIATIKKLLPNLSPAISIPPAQPPVKVN